MVGSCCRRVDGIEDRKQQVKIEVRGGKEGQCRIEGGIREGGEVVGEGGRTGWGAVGG